MNLGETLRLLSPELLLLFTGLVVLVVDLVWGEEEKKTIWVPTLALIGLALMGICQKWVGLTRGSDEFESKYEDDGGAMGSRRHCCGRARFRRLDHGIRRGSHGV